jgi:hypothetical protein
MASGELTLKLARRSRHFGPAAGERALAWPVLQCALAILAATLVGIALAHVDPALAPATRPHPTLRPSPAAIASILANNARVLTAPFILIAARFARSPRAAIVGDAVIGLIVGGNALVIGLAIGRWDDALAPYLPHLPLEYLATSTAAAAWVHTRRATTEDGSADRRATATYGAATVALLLIAASVEVLLTPHAR